jgi:hypothetical protein
MMKPIDASVPATDDYMTLLPSFKGRGNMAKLYKGEAGWAGRGGWKAQRGRGSGKGAQ